MSSYDSPAACLPHHAPMILVDRVIAVEEESVHCQVSTHSEGILAPFLNAEGELPAWYGIEMMAQTIGVWSGWHARQAGALTIQPGMLLGGRGWRAEAPAFPADVILDICMHLLMRDDRMGSFEGEIRHGERLLASGRLNTWQPDEQALQQLRGQGKKP